MIQIMSECRTLLNRLIEFDTPMKFVFQENQTFLLHDFGSGLCIWQVKHGLPIVKVWQDLFPSSLHNPLLPPK